jgi:DNA repair exonuclease SbcCD ATPase subunit
MAGRSVNKEIDRLYGLPREEFTAARDRAAKDLRSGGDREGAATVKGLRRPTVAAWAVNQMVRRERQGLADLLESGDRLRKAQRRALSGVSAGGLQEAAADRRRAVNALVKAAQAILQEAGQASSSTLEAVHHTLEAASVDEEAGRLVQQGRLAKELSQPAGFGSVDGLSLVPAPPEPEPSRRPAPSKKAERAKASASGSAAAERAAARLAELRAERDRIRREVRDLDRSASQARRAAQRAGQAAVKAAEEAERARREAEEARRKARDLAAAAREASSEADRTQREADRATRSLEQAEARVEEGRS